MQRAEVARGGVVLFPVEEGVWLWEGSQARVGGAAAGDSWSQGTGSSRCHLEPGSILGAMRSHPR